MRYLLFALGILISSAGFGQEPDPGWYQHCFTRELKGWTESFNHFRLATFRLKDTQHFDTSSASARDLKKVWSFLRTYKPILTFTRDSLQFIDIYSYQLNLVKEGDHYDASPDIDQQVFLCNRRRKYWNVIFFGSEGQWVDEVIWISDTRFILVGVYKNEQHQNAPMILVGDEVQQVLYRYESADGKCVQRDSGYESWKLKKMKIEGM